MNYLYASDLLFMVLVIFFAFKTLVKAPYKIRVLTFFSLVLLFLRYMVLVTVFFSNKINNLYYLKFGYFLSLAAIPIVIVIVSYIIWRNTKIEFSFISAISIIFFIFYIFIIVNNGVILGVFRDYRLGYSMNFINEYVIIYYGGINLVALIFTLGVLNESDDRAGVILCSLAALISIIETVAYTLDFILIPQYLLGEFFWIICLIYLLNKFKR